jgi:hypothetical protein
VTALRVEVLETDIPDAPPHKTWDDPLAAALARLTGQDVAIDSAGDYEYMATIGSGGWTLVVDLPRAASEWLDERWNGKAMGPIAFDLQIPDWVVVLVAKAATTDEQARAVIASEAAS